MNGALPEGAPVRRSGSARASPGWRTRARRFLRSPRTIVVELAAIALSGVASTLVSQNPTRADQAALALRSPGAAALVRALGLDHVFTTWWFLAAVAVAAASLGVVVDEQVRRVVREWRTPGEAAFRTAPYRRELSRAARGAPGLLAETRGRAGSLGSPVFHVGLAAVVVAGILRALFSATAVVDLHEGETLPPGAAAFAAQWPGFLARPVALAQPLTLRELRPARYPSGALRSLDGEVLVGPSPGGRPATLAVNDPLDLGPVRVYLTQTHGIAMFVEVADGGHLERRIAMLEEGDGWYARAELFPGAVWVRARVAATAGGRPGPAEVRVLRGHALLGAGVLGVGDGLELPGGTRVVLRDLRWWGRLEASRDAAAWLAFAGFGLALGGAALMFAVVRVDSLVAVRAEGDVERVVVAMRPHRFAPLFAARFEAMVRREGDGPDGDSGRKDTP